MTDEDTLYHVEGYTDDDLHDADIVEWYEARQVTVSTPVAVGTVIGAFTLGVLTAVGALVLMGRLED
ncbi:MAG TPA: hypothetical protein VFF48_11680 [Brevundimonas sp.]|nr:hypothetical protein [Brevundimonas sp.]